MQDSASRLMALLEAAIICKEILISFSFKMSYLVLFFPPAKLKIAPLKPELML